MVIGDFRCIITYDLIQFDSLDTGENQICQSLSDNLVAYVFVTMLALFTNTVFSIRLSSILKYPKFILIMDLCLLELLAYHQFLHVF